MNYIHKIFNDLHVDNAISLEDLEAKYDQKAKQFVETNELCRIIQNYSRVFTEGTVENGPSSVALEARKTGKTVAEILASVN